MDNQNPAVRARASSLSSAAAAAARLREVLDVSSLPGCSLGVDAAQVEGTLLGSDSGYANGGDDNYMIDEAITPGEVFDMIRDIKDPEHPLTLEQLSVVDLDHVSIQQTPEP